MTSELTAVPVFRLPEEYRHMGEPSAWAKMTRPGQPMHSFLEAAFFDADGNLWLSDVPYGRIFKVSPEGDWSLAHQIDGEPHAMRITPDGRHIAVDYRHGLIELTGQSDFNVLSTGLESQPFWGSRTWPTHPMARFGSPIVVAHHSATPRAASIACRQWRVAVGA